MRMPRVGLGRLRAAAESSDARVVVVLVAGVNDLRRLRRGKTHGHANKSRVQCKARLPLTVARARSRGRQACQCWDLSVADRCQVL